MTWWQSQTAALRGTLMLLVAMVFFTVMLVLIRIAGQRLPVIEVIVVRTVVMQVAVLAVAGPRVRRVFRTNRPKLQIFRALLSLGATAGTFIAVVHLPLALGTAISFTYAIFVTLGAALLLREAVDAARWTAVVVGFIGAGLMLFPVAAGSLPFVLIAFAGAIFSAGVILTVRSLDPSEPVETVTYQSLLVLPVLLIPTILTWVPPTPLEWAVLVLVGLSGTAGQWLLIVAYQRVEASLLAPLDFARLLMMTACGLLFFNEIPTLSLFIGVIIVLGTTIFTVRSNATSGPTGPTREAGFPRERDYLLS
jgi:drug/metabolite transporter (DMT)-like permease